MTLFVLSIKGGIFEKEDWGLGKENEWKVGSEEGGLNKSTLCWNIRFSNIPFQIKCVFGARIVK